MSFIMMAAAIIVILGSSCREQAEVPWAGVGNVAGAAAVVALFAAFALRFANQFRHSLVRRGGVRPCGGLASASARGLVV